MAREKYFWDVTVGISYVPHGSNQLSHLDVLTHQDPNIRSAVARIRDIILEETSRNFAADGFAPSCLGQAVDSLLFTVSVRKGVQNGQG